MAEDHGFIVRILKDEWENRLYRQRAFYVGIKRDWSQGSKLLFVRKTDEGDDAFIGSGTIESIVKVADLTDKLDKKICLENNFSDKIIFEKLARFYPAIPLSLLDIQRDDAKNAPIHGLKIGLEEIEKIENKAHVKIIY